MTEPGAGSDVRGMQCTARPDGDDWVVNGIKHFISHADLARFRHRIRRHRGGEDPLAGRRSVSRASWSTAALPASRFRSGYDSVSHRGYHNCILTFDDCRLPSAQILGEAHRGFELANEWLYATRITVAAMCVGTRSAGLRPGALARGRAAGSSASRSDASRGCRSSSPT